MKLQILLILQERKRKKRRLKKKKGESKFEDVAEMGEQEKMKAGDESKKKSKDQ